MRWLRLIFATWVILIVLTFAFVYLLSGGDGKRKAVELKEDTLNPYVLKKRQETLDAAEAEEGKGPTKPENAPETLDEKTCAVSTSHCSQISTIITSGRMTDDLKRQKAWCDYVLFQCSQLGVPQDAGFEKK